MTGHPEKIDNTIDIFIGRQAIYDLKMDVFAYELLYRHSLDNKASFNDGNLATTQVITSIFIDLGLENLVGSKPAFINLTADFFAGDYPLPMSNEQVIFELLEDVLPSPEVMAGIRRLRDLGYLITLDDYLITPQTIPFLEFASFIKLDVLQMSHEELTQSVRRLKKYPVQLIAEKIETPEQYKFCRELGFDLFQGYFFSYPDVIQSQTLGINRGVALSLITQLRNPDADLSELEHVIAHDPVLSYRLLRYINCATFSLRREVESIREALMLLGLDTVRNWATLLILSKVGNNKPQELMTLALIRARMCEQLAPVHDGLDANQAFTIGLFSLIDAILGETMDILLDEIPLSVNIKLALLDHEGPLGMLLKNVIHYERAEWDELELPGGEAGHYRNAYLSAVNWADSSRKALYDNN